ncbi:Glycosyltransferase 61 [Gracilaria domingensis]|nr:Glycosyltransferase 61 [Gracilaria domingensis]
MHSQRYAFLIAAFFFLVTQTILLSKVHVQYSTEVKQVRRKKLSIPGDVLRSFCHSDPGIDARRITMKTKLNCFGDCDQQLKVAQKGARAILAPPVTRLCFDNPFHGFYDCIWPLVHYLSTCVSARETPELILYDIKNISAIRQAKWVIHAQQAFLRNIGEEFKSVDRTELPRCTCYNHIVRFRRNTMWRPVRFHSRATIGNNTVISPHPTGLKRLGLQLFRRAVLNEFGLNSEPLEGTLDILIYGREDVFRRRWLNVDEFERMLQQAIPTNARIKRWKTPDREQRDAFETQVRQMNGAAVVIAPHGGGMVNTLFCRRRTAVIEIASRRCAMANESVFLNEAMDVNDENTWTPWHADSLELVHFAAPCWYSRSGEYDFYADTEELVRLVQIALHARQQV